MKTFLEVLEALKVYSPWEQAWVDPAWKAYLQTGDETHLATLPQGTANSWSPPRELLLALALPDTTDETGKRFLKGCIITQHPNAVGAWLQECASRDGVEFAKGCALIEQLGGSKVFIAKQLVERSPHQFGGGISRTSLNVADQFLMSLSEAQAIDLFRSYWHHQHRAGDLTSLFAAHAPRTWSAVLKEFAQDADLKHLDPRSWEIALAGDPAGYKTLAARAFELQDNWSRRFQIGAALAKVDSATYEPKLEAMAHERLSVIGPGTKAQDWGAAETAVKWLIVNRGSSALPHVERFITASPPHEQWRDNGAFARTKDPVVDLAVATLRRNAIPVLEATFATAQAAVQLNAMKQWATIREPSDTDAIVKHLRELLVAKDLTVVAQAVRLISDLRIDALEPDLWTQLSHKSKQVRDAASATVAKLGDSRLPKTAEMWKIKRAEPRLAAVAWLRALGTPGAIAALRSRLDHEEADDVRDAILLALEALEGATQATDPEELDRRIQKTSKKIDGSPVDWLDTKQLPAAKLTDGTTLSANKLLYLLYRQSRVKDMRADIEARALYAQIDRSTSGDLALAVLNAFFASKADADDRWTMAFAALIGDDRLVPVIVRQVKTWADAMRGKLAEYAVEAMALLGTDVALVAVDAMAIRYRSKNKNIGKAAGDAFVRAADARGVTVQELGDLVVPWLGFQPGQPRIVDTAKARVEARIGNDFKLAFRDVATNKKVAKLPAGVPAEVQAEFKELTAALKEAAKSQQLRMEALVVRQFRWSAARWRELYLEHPLLLPFAQQLVWGAYDASGALGATFRALEDRSLTDAADETYVLPPDAVVGLVHPLELTPELRQQWLAHLADYDVTPPIAQLDRAIVTATDEQRSTKHGTEVADTTLNAMTFKGRAERLGWSRGSVCDAGGIGHYLKTFPGAGVDVFVEIDGMYVGIDMNSDITLGKVFFVTHGSVKIGSYVYDEPSDTNDSRLVAFGDVAPVAFSESMGDLNRIAARAEPQ